MREDNTCFRKGICMASTLEFVEYVAEQLHEAGNISYKKLFGEYGLWCDGKFFGTVEGNQFYVKMTQAGHEMMPEAVPAAPHGGRPGMYLVEELEDTAFLKELTERTLMELPEPKAKSGKRKQVSNS